MWGSYRVQNRKKIMKTEKYEIVIDRLIKSTRNDMTLIDIMTQ